MRRWALTLALVLGGAPALCAQRAERRVLPGGRGPNQLALDATFLAGAQPFKVGEVTAAEGRVAVATGGGSDLRLFDRATREVPYLLITPRVEARWRATRLLPVAPTKVTSAFEVDLETSLLIDRVRFAGLPAPFLKRVQLEGSGDRTHWTLLVADGTLFDLPNEDLELTALDFVAGAYRYLRLTWDDRSSRRMPLPRQVEARIASPTHGPAPLRTPIVLERRPSEPGKSRFRLRLPGAHLPIVAIELAVAGGDILRSARITEGRLDGSTVVPTELGSATLRRSVRDGVAAAQLRIPIAPPSESELELSVDDGSNSPLDATGATAVFAALSFIYFESTGDTLIARYGNDRLVPPRYDLEAERDRVPSLALSAAHWGGTGDLAAAAPDSTVAMPITGATIDVGGFRYTRALPLGTPGLTTLPLDAAALAHGSLADTRIATADGHQVPFLVERLDEPLSVALPMPARITRRGDPGSRTRYRIQLPYSGLPAGRLIVHTDARVFNREVALQMLPSADDDPRARGGPVTLSTTAWRHTDPDQPASALSLELPPVRVAEVTLVIDEGDNAPLPIRDATLLLPAYRLRFFRDAHTPLRLIYGRSDLTPPRYDLALLAPRLLGAPAHDIVPGAEQEGADVTGVTPTIVFWCALGAAVLVLIVMIARLLRPGGGAPATPASASPTSTSSAPSATGE
ncbi:MAG: DUF3999 family protein [Gemmatimonadaceae bacterium]